MSIISVNRVSKVFRTPVHYPGVLGSIRTLFTRSYHTVKAVDEVSFEIERGELVGYIGPNGAGKSTTIKMLTGILYPTSGYVQVLGLVPYKERQRNAYNMGVVFGQRTQLWWDLPLIDSFELLRGIYRIPKKVYQENMALFSKLLDIDDLLGIPVRQLSLGQRMRGDLVASLIHNPPILYLDEPTIGLDVVAKERIREFIAGINQEKKVTVILTTHDLSDVEALCKRIMILDHGKIVYDGTLEDIRARFGKRSTLIIDFARVPERLDIPQAELVKLGGHRAWVEFEAEKISASDLIALITRKYSVADLTVEKAKIESIIREIYQEGL